MARQGKELVTKNRAKFTKKQIADWFLSHGGICHICGGKIVPGQLWERDHEIPLGAGGSDTLDNQRPAHKSCHAKKTRKDRKVIAKTERQRQKHLGVRKESRWQNARGGRYKTLVGGKTVLR